MILSLMCLLHIKYATQQWSKTRDLSSQTFGVKEKLLSLQTTILGVMRGEEKVEFLLMLLKGFMGE